MTFGQALKSILALSGVTLSQLAVGLGYDSSYVSRLTNDLKLPSLKNNEELFKNLSQVFYECSSDTGRERLAGRLDCNDREIPLYLSAFFSEAYSRHSPDGQRAAPAFESNAYYIPGHFKASMPAIGRFTKEALFTAARLKPKKSVECICASKLSITKSTLAPFIESVSGGLKVTTHYFLDMEDFTRNVDDYCKAICVFMGQGKDIEYVFYEAEQCGVGSGFPFENFFMIEDQLFMIGYYNPLLERDDTVYAQGGEWLREEFTILMARISHMYGLFSLISYDKQGSRELKRLLNSYLIDSKMLCFMNLMQPMCMEPQMFCDLSGQYERDPHAEVYNEYLSRFDGSRHASIVMYNSCIENYLFSGEMFIFGKVYKLSARDRLRHLKHMLARLRAGSCELTILDDFNPLFKAEDACVSFFLNSKSGIMVLPRSEAPAVYCMNSLRAVNHFREFFSHMQALEKSYCISGEQAEELIERGIAMLEGSPSC